MSKYTTEVRFICETYAGLDKSVGQSSVSDVIEKSRSKVFDFNFPIYDESYRSVLETKILKHYYTREIGFETVGLWKQFLDMKLNEIMPYYNQLYESTTLKFNPLYDVDVTTDSNRDIGHDEKTTDINTRTDNLNEATTTQVTRTDNLNESTTAQTTRTDNLNETTTRNANTNESETSKSTNRYSDTPQGGLDGIEANTYLTHASIDESTSNLTNTSNTSGNRANTGTQTTNIDETKTNTGTQTTNSNGTRANTGTQVNDNNGTRNYTNTDEYLEHVYGKRGGITYSKMLQEYRETFLNIDLMIINELRDLFMNLW